MPKQVKEKKQEKEYRPSPISVNRPKEIDKLDCAEPEEKTADGEKTPHESILNSMWIGAVQKGQGTGMQRSESLPDWSECDSIGRKVALFSQSLDECDTSTFTTQSRSEARNFGENPQYHDEGFSYTSSGTRPFGSVPPLSFEPRFYSTNINLQAHKRSSSTTHQSLHQDVEYPIQSSTSSTAQFPLPTIRPATPPEGTPTSGLPSLAVTRYREPGPGQVTVFRYTRQITNDRLHQHRRAQSVPTTTQYKTPTTSSIHSATDIKGEMTIDGATGREQEGEFQPVVIFEHGQSVTGQRWRRKVTVFRSEVLENLEREGLIRCP